VVLGSKVTLRVTTGIIDILGHFENTKRIGMITINKTQEVSAPLDSVWDVVADLEHEHDYWSALNNIKILSRNGNTIEREATITRGPMGSAKSVQTLVLDPKKSTILTLTKGPMIGTRKVVVSSLGEKKTKIQVDWEFEMKGVPGFAIGFVQENISKVTENALELIAREAEKTSVTVAKSVASN
jgi:carbon monoxide dehydrogenase subunit G